MVVPLSRRLILPLLLYFDERLFRLCFAVCGADAQGGPGRDAREGEQDGLCGDQQEDVRRD